jgi:hypothetical protein
MSGNDKSSLVSGSVPTTLLGNVRLFFSKNVPRHVEAGNQTAYSMVFGYSDATAYFFREVVNRVIDSDANSYNTYWDRLYAYDFDVIDERFMGVLYGTLNFS